MLGEKHLELTVILDTKGITRATSGSRWFGFYFCGTVASVEKCFQKKYHNLKSIFNLVEAGFTKSNNEPYSSPLLVIGDMIGSSENPSATNQAFWQVRSEDQSKVVGFIPLFHRTDVFHTIPDYPLVSFERNPTAEDSHGMILSLCTNVDRNNLPFSRTIPSPLELDELYNATLHQATTFLKSEKWRMQVTRGVAIRHIVDSLRGHCKWCE